MPASSSTFSLLGDPTSETSSSVCPSAPLSLPSSMLLGGRSSSSSPTLEDLSGVMYLCSSSASPRALASRYVHASNLARSKRQADPFASTSLLLLLYPAQGTPRLRANQPRTRCYRDRHLPLVSLRSYVSLPSYQYFLSFLVSH
jgi:hypothetical protein